MFLELILFCFFFAWLARSRCECFSRASWMVRSITLIKKSRERSRRIDFKQLQLEPPSGCGRGGGGVGWQLASSAGADRHPRDGEERQ